MKITVLGCGNAFSTENYNVCYLLEDIHTPKGEEVLERGATAPFKRHMLIDAGWALPFMLKNGAVNINDITDVYISHLHSDHIGGLEYLGFSRYNWGNKPAKAPANAVKLYGNARLLEELWSKSLIGGMESLEGMDCNLDTFFNVQRIQPNADFNWCGWSSRPIQQIHIVAGSMISSTFGLMMKQTNAMNSDSPYDARNIYFVTDSQHCSPRQAEVFYKQADVIFQDCEAIGVDTKNKKMNFCSNVHANYGQLASYEGSNSTILSADIKAKMWLTHYQDFVHSNKDFYGNDCDWSKMVIDDGFAGLIKVGQIFEF